MRDRNPSKDQRKPRAEAMSVVSKSDAMHWRSICDEAQSGNDLIVSRGSDSFTRIH